MDPSFRVIAVISAYNEADIIGPMLRHLIEQGVDAYLIDDRSTDETVALAKRFLGRGLIHIETFDRPGAPADGEFRWEAILRRKEQLARELQADWFIHHDADEIRESPWANLRFRDAIQLVDRLGYNAIDSAVLNFWPTPGSRAEDPVGSFEYYECGATFDKLQVKCWKRTNTPVDLVSTGGHDVQFEGRRVFPVRFILRHYPIRSQAHGERKIFVERRPRFAPQERARGWHVQYDALPEGTPLVRDPATLVRYEPDKVRAELTLVHRGVESLQLERDTALGRADDAERRVAEAHHLLKSVTGERDELRGELESTRASVTRLELARRDQQDTLDRVHHDLATRAFELQRAHAQLSELLGSRTWRWTAFARAMASAFFRR